MAEIRTETAIVGAGQAGVPLARALAEAGRLVVLVERRHLGGSCVNFGCTPSKAVIASARLAAAARRAGAMGVGIPSVAVDFAAVMARARRLVAESRGSLEESFRGRDNPRLLCAEARLEGRRDGLFRLRAGGDVVLAERVVLDTGTRSARPPLPGLNSVPLVDSESWVGLEALPGHLVFLGGGTIALEMAQCFRRLGAEVTVLEQGERLAEHEDPDVAEALCDALEADGVEVRLGVEAVRAVPEGEGLRVHLRGGEVVEGTHLFLAAGREANSDGLGLETLGVVPGKRGVVAVDGGLCAGVPGLYAAGDLRGGAQFTHAAYDDFRVLRDRFLGDGTATTERVVPYAIFTEPELGRVGLSETQARAAGRAVRVGRYRMRDSGKAREIGRTEGFVKVVADAGTGEILGAAVLCAEGAEVVQLFTQAMVAGATAREMLRAIAIHPTFGEAAKNAVAALVDG
ncbi:FAD-dependent oxidoreductase [Roseomonas sp. NAR14]|uniref:FAD-dependent oxidoreductase n=1 Tax=Roseomonas acroporae TaxID=2937791 RepID=A0A9X1Y9U0_9PROT|nr:FAD-dependent oxidoreductase [Roseomonas acroporae]MCK8786784.1 FAD-dependent oxidoreductase [Roseomonas acroporae]